MLRRALSRRTVAFIMTLFLLTIVSCIALWFIYDMGSDIREKMFTERGAISLLLKMGFITSIICTASMFLAIVIGERSMIQSTIFTVVIVGISLSVFAGVETLSNRIPSGNSAVVRDSYGREMSAMEAYSRGMAGAIDKFSIDEVFFDELNVLNYMLFVTPLMMCASGVCVVVYLSQCRRLQIAQEHGT